MKNFASRALKRELRQKYEDFRRFQGNVFELPHSEMEGMVRVCDVVIGVSKDDRRPQWLSKFNNVW